MKLLALGLIVAGCPFCVIATAWFMRLKGQLSTEERIKIQESRGVRGQLQAVANLSALAFGIFGAIYFGINYSIVVTIPLLIVVTLSELLDLWHFTTNANANELSSLSRKTWIAPSLLVLCGCTLIGVGTILYLFSA